MYIHLFIYTGSSYTMNIYLHVITFIGRDI